MKKIYQVITLMFTAGLITLAGCKKKDDEKPAIKVNSPTNHQHYQRGETIKLDATFTDNKELGEYRIDVHLAGNHTHKMESAEWDFEYTGELNGGFQELKLDIVIAADADTGSYDFLVECIDNAGNEAEFVLIEIEIK